MSLTPLNDVFGHSGPGIPTCPDRKEGIGPRLSSDGRVCAAAVTEPEQAPCPAAQLVLFATDRRSRRAVTPSIPYFRAAARPHSKEA